MGRGTVTAARIAACIAGCVAALAAIAPARADCLDEIRAILGAYDHNRINTRARLVTTRDGSVIETRNAWYRDINNFMYEIVGRDLWVLAREGIFYTSNTGKTWRRAPNQLPEGWAEAGQKRARADRELIRDGECGQSAEIDGKRYDVYRYVFAKQTPPAQKYTETLYVDPADNRVHRYERVYLLREPPVTLTGTVFHDQTFTLPRP